MAGFFACREHAYHQRGNAGLSFKPFSQGAALFDGGAGFDNRIADDDVAAGARDDLEGIEDGHAALHHQREDTADPGDAGFLDQQAKDREVEHQAIKLFGARVGLLPFIEEECAAADTAEHPQAAFVEESAHVDQKLCRRRKRGAELLEHVPENRYDEGDQADGDGDGDAEDDDGVGHGRLDLASQACGGFE